MQILERYLHMVLLMEMEKKDEFLYKKVRRLVSIIILVVIVAMVATMVIPYLV